MKNIILSAIAVFTLTSCGSTHKSLYSWYDYEDCTYQYNKKRTDELKVKVLEQYEKMTTQQKGLRGTVPPGLYAEYGFMLCKNGKTEEGLKYLKEEIKMYPESETYISRIIKQLEK